MALMTSHFDQAVIRATFADWRTVRTRRVLQLVFEIPLEQQQFALSILGAPMPDRETWAAIALLAEPVGQPEKPKDLARSMAARTRYQQADVMERARQRAGMLPKDQKFRAWLRVTSEDDAAAYIRRACKIASRRDIASNPDAHERFLRVETDFMMFTGQLPEDRSGIDNDEPFGLRPIADEPASPAGAEDAAEAETIPHRSPPTASAAPSLAQKPESPTKWELTASALLEDFRVATDRKRFRVTRGPEIHAVHESAPRVWGKLIDAMSEIERDSGEA